MEGILNKLSLSYEMLFTTGKIIFFPLVEHIVSFNILSQCKT